MQCWTTYSCKASLWGGSVWLTLFDGHSSWSSSSFPSYVHLNLFIVSPCVGNFVDTSISLIRIELLANFPPDIFVLNETPQTSTWRSCLRAWKSYISIKLRAVSLWLANWANASVLLVRIWRPAYALGIYFCAFLRSSTDCIFSAPSTHILTAIFAIGGSKMDAFFRGASGLETVVGSAYRTGSLRLFLPASSSAKILSSIGDFTACISSRSLLRMLKALTAFSMTSVVMPLSCLSQWRIQRFFIGFRNMSMFLSIGAA